MKPEARDAFIAGAKACIAETRKEKGCIAYENHISINDPNTFVVVERWESREDLNAHARAPHMKVWRELCNIPFGATISYAELARRIGRPTASRAVGHSNARNPISIIVPCHRVIGADNSLTGYAGGLERKRALLALEARNLGTRDERKVAREGQLAFGGM